MTNQKLQKILEAIQKLVAAEVKSQMLTVKADITRQVIAEIKRSGTTASPNGQYKKKTYSSNPLLNEVLAQTEMNVKLITGEPEDIVDDYGQPLNVTVQDSSGKAVNFSNPAVQSVLEAMNRKYDVPVTPVQKPSPQQRQQIDPNIAKNYTKSMMEISDDDIETGKIYIPDPFSETGR